MKKIVLGFLFALFTLLALTQYTNAQVKSRIIFKDGKKISGVIIPSNSNDSVSVQLDGGLKVAYPKSNIKEIESLRKILSLGLGIGIPYGMFGINTEIEPAPHIGLTFAIGTTILSGMAWEVGAIGYILDQDYFIRPRISLFYGINSMIEIPNTNYYSNQTIFESFTGLTIGGGVKFMLGKSHGTTFDVLYLLSNGAVDRSKELEKIYTNYHFTDLGIPIKFAWGYQYSF